MQIKRKKRLIISLLLTLVIMLLISPFYSGANMDNFFRAFNSKEARLNLFFSGDKDNQLQVVDLSKRVKSEQPDWYNNPSWMKTPGRGTMVQAKIYRQFRKYELQYKAIGNGTVSIHLLGPHNKWDNGKIYPVWVYYKNFKVNGKEIFFDTKKLGYEKGYKYDISLKHGDSLKIEFEAKRHIPLNLIFGIEPLLFISCLAISFLLSRLLVYWLSQFKIKEHHSRIDIVFLSVFFVLLLIPISHINQDEKSVQENRMLAKYVPLIDNQGHINLKYGKNFEAWFNDRFNARDLLTSLHTYILFNINTYYETSKAYIGKEGFVYTVGMNMIELDNRPEYIQKYIIQLNWLYTFCSKNNIKPYILIAPVKDNVYSEFSPRKKHFYNNTTLFLQKLSKQVDIPIIYPLSESMAAKQKDYVFFKTDHHWTEWGAYIAYQALMKEIQKTFPAIQAIPESDFNVFYSNKVRAEHGRGFGLGTAKRNLNFPDKYINLDANYKYYEHKEEKLLTVLKDDRLETKEYTYPHGANLTAVVVGTSFIENFMQFFPYNFKKSFKYRANTYKESNLNISRWEKNIKENNTDILIIVLQESAIPMLLSLNKGLDDK